jgi:hypothetical protein
VGLLLFFATALLAALLTTSLKTVPGTSNSTQQAAACAFDISASKQADV